MHKWYMTHLECLGIELANQAWYENYLGAGPALKNKAAALVRFDREIILAQKMFDMAASKTNQPHGDLNDMSTKVPTAIQLNGHIYFLDLDARNSMAPEVIVKPDDSAVIGSLKYKVELDMSEVYALLDKLTACISETKLVQDLAQPATLGEAIFDPQPFLINNGTIIINQAAVDDAGTDVTGIGQGIQAAVGQALERETREGGILWQILNK